MQNVLREETYRHDNQHGTIGSAVVVGTIELKHTKPKCIPFGLGSHCEGHILITVSC